MAVVSSVWQTAYKHTSNGVESQTWCELRMEKKKVN